MKITEVATYAKAVAALVGSIVTALVGILPPDQYQWLAIVSAIATAIVTYKIPNALATDQNVPGAHELV